MVGLLLSNAPREAVLGLRRIIVLLLRYSLADTVFLGYFNNLPMKISCVLCELNYELLCFRSWSNHPWLLSPNLILKYYYLIDKQINSVLSHLQINLLSMYCAVFT